MDDIPRPVLPPTDWLEALAESEADLAAGHIVSGEVVMRELHENLARVETKKAAKLARKSTPRR
jgi:hypothetical protein